MTGEIYITVECEVCKDTGDDEIADYGDTVNALTKALEELGYKEDTDFVFSMPADYTDPENPYICQTHDDDMWDWTRNTINANGENVCTDFRITGIPLAKLETMKTELVDYMYDEDSRKPTATFYEDVGYKGAITDYDVDADQEEVKEAAPGADSPLGACWESFTTVFGAQAYLEKAQKEPICGNKVPTVDVGALPTADDSSKTEKNFAKALREAVEEEILAFQKSDCPEDKDLKKCVEALADLQVTCADVNEDWAVGLVGDLKEELGVISSVCVEDPASAASVLSAGTALLFTSAAYTVL